MRSSKDKEVLADDEIYEEFNPSFTYPVRREPNNLRAGVKRPLFFASLSRRFMERTRKYMGIRV